MTSRSGSIGTTKRFYNTLIPILCIPSAFQVRNLTVYPRKSDAVDPLIPYTFIKGWTVS